MEELEHIVLPYWLVLVGVLGAVVIAVLVGLLTRRQKTRSRDVRNNRGRPTTNYRDGTRDRATSANFSETATITQINNILTSIERRFGLTPKLGYEPILIEQKLERIRDRLNAINSGTFYAEKNESVTPPVSNEPVVGPGWSLDSVQNTPAPPVRTFAEEFAEMYNRARDNKEERNLFWSKFQAIQIGNRNASDQRMGRTTETDFRKTDVGDFLAIQNMDTGNYLVVPHFTLVIDDTSYRFGGVEAAFECDFTPGASHQQFQVVTPAEFVVDGDTWIRSTQGKLSFGNN